MVVQCGVEPPSRAYQARALPPKLQDARIELPTDFEFDR